MWQCHQLETQFLDIEPFALVKEVRLDFNNLMIAITFATFICNYDILDCLVKYGKDNLGGMETLAEHFSCPAYGKHWLFLLFLYY